jgi:SPP1 gp7 family putative phage head morphogenesis protein
MNVIHQHNDNCTCDLQVNAAQIDPTRTVTLRNAFAKAMRVRFKVLTRLIVKAIVEQDVFGLLERPEVFQDLPGVRAFQFMTSQEKVEAFMAWLQEQIDSGILQVTRLPQVGEAINQAWTDLYIEDSYKRGVIRARYELDKAGFLVPPLASTGGIAASMLAPFHMDRVGLMFTRTYQGLKGITAAMDSQISRVLSQGIADGDSPRLLARKLVATINGTGAGDLAIVDSIGRTIPAQVRAETLARTELIRAHHNATIQEYRNWGVLGIKVKAEWITAGDGRVCERCASLEGRIFTLDEVEGMIPVHPNCRCLALPYIIE